MDPFEYNYFVTNRKLMSIFGVWHTQKSKERFFRIYITVMLFFYTIPDQVCQFFMVDLDLRTIVTVLQAFIPYASIASIYFTAILQFITFQKIFFCIKQDWERIKDEVELKIMQRHAYVTKLITNVSIVAVAVYVAFLIFPPVLRNFFSKSERTFNNFYLPVISCLYYLLDQNTYYYPTILYQITFVIFVSVLIVCCYTTYFLIVQHICACLYLIKNEIHRPFIKNNRNVPVKPIDLSRWIIDIVQRLNRITKFVNLLNTLIEHCCLIQMSLACALLIIDFLWLLQIPTLIGYVENKRDMIQSFLFVLTTLFTMYTNCYIGQRLIDYSMDVYKEACLVPIHEISLETQKLLLTTLMMSVKPYSLSIGKVFVLSHEFFADLIRTALSFAMMLYSIQKI